MKRTLVLLLSVMLLSGCASESGYKLTKPIGEVSTPELLALSYENFDGVKFGDHFPVASGEIVEFHVNVETRGGSLTIYLTPEGDKDDIVYIAEDLPTSEFSFTIETPGEYALYLKAENHKGGYSITTSRRMK